MAVFRVERTRDYTVMSNHHFKNRTISLKAKGLLSEMLSLPDDWDYTLRGLATINKEGIDSIREGIKELEWAGYVERKRIRNSKGQLVGTEYVIYERPENSAPTPTHPTPSETTTTHAKAKTVKKTDPSTCDIPTQEALPQPFVPSSSEVDYPSQICASTTQTPVPITFSPTLETPTLAKPAQENPTQLKTKLTLTNTYPNKINITHDESHPSIMVSNQTERRTKGRMDGMDLDSLHKFYQCEIRSNLDYFELPLDYPYEKLDEIVTVMADALCTQRNTISIGGDFVPLSLVKERFLSLKYEHVEYVMDCIKKTKTEIRNIKRYLLTALFNAPTTIKSYYDALFQRERHNQRIACLA